MCMASKGFSFFKWKIDSCVRLNNYATKSTQNVAQVPRGRKVKHKLTTPVTDWYGNTYYRRARKVRVFRKDHRRELLRTL